MTRRPVEFQLAGINQVQMKEQIGLNFAAALRAFLRQDPNIILSARFATLKRQKLESRPRLRPLGALHVAHNDAPSTITV